MATYQAYCKDGSGVYPLGSGRIVHSYTIAANSAKNWYRIGQSTVGQLHPMHAQFILRASNPQAGVGYYQSWFVDLEVYGQQAGIRVMGNSGSPISQIRVLYENTASAVSDSKLSYIDIYLNYVLANATSIEIEEVLVHGMGFFADGAIAASSVPSGYENMAQGVYANGILYCSLSDQASYTRLQYTNISANTTLAVNTTYAMRVLNCTGTITLTLPSPNSNQGWFFIKNNGTGTITLKPASASVYFDNVSANIALEPKESVLLACQSSGHYSILVDGRIASTVSALATRVATLEDWAGMFRA